MDDPEADHGTDATNAEPAYIDEEQQKNIAVLLNKKGYTIERLLTFVSNLTGNKVTKMSDIPVYTYQDIMDAIEPSEDVPQ